MMGKIIRESELINNTFFIDYINLTTSFQLNKIGKNGLGKMLAVLGILFRVTRALSTKKYDVCYMTLTATGPGFYKDFLILGLVKMFGCPIVYHLHNKGFSRAGKNKINNLLYQVTFKNSRVILLSRLLFEDIKRFVKTDQVLYCYNGLPEVAAVSDSTVTRSGVDHHTCRLIFLSNMMVEKGVFVALEACMLLKERKLDFECHFVGDWVDIKIGEFTKYVEDNNLSDIVIAHGPKYGAEKFQMLSEMDVFVFPTYFHNETFGLVNIEAMQAGLPIVSTTEGGIPDVVLNNITGFVVPPKNIPALADRLALLIKNSELRQEMGRAGKQRYYELFTLEKFEKNFIDTISNALSVYSLPKRDISSSLVLTEIGEKENVLSV
jgi:glycosyltransferase involved in cell wall biosynthesis